MKQKEDRRTKKDRRDSSDKRSEKFIKYFLPEEKEKRNGEDRRKSNSDNE
jgi:hypothetical protein